MLSHQKTLTSCESNSCHVIQRLQFSDSALVTLTQLMANRSRLTWIGLSVAVGPRWWEVVSSLHLQSVRTLLLTIEHYFCKHFTGLRIYFKKVFALISRRVHNIIRHLKTQSWLVSPLRYQKYYTPKFSIHNIVYQSLELVRVSTFVLWLYLYFSSRSFWSFYLSRTVIHIYL